MPRYGNYDTVRPLDHSALGLVTTARQPQSESLHVVKVYKPPREVWDEETVKRERARFLSGADIQRRLAGARHWRPVQEHDDTIDDESYYVGTYCRGSARAVIAGRVPLVAATLYAIVDGVLTGLDELKRVCGRSHGNLKSSNVLLDYATPPEWRVFLTDPAGIDSDAAHEGTDESGEAKDLKALGHLIFELVTWRPASPREVFRVFALSKWSKLGRKRDFADDLARDGIGWLDEWSQLEGEGDVVEYLRREGTGWLNEWWRLGGKGDDGIGWLSKWSQLGRKRDGWLELCNRLLNSTAEDSIRSHDELREQLKGLKAIDWGPATRWTAAGVGTAAAVVVVSATVAGNATITMPWGRRPVPPGPQVVIPKDPVVVPKGPDVIRRAPIPSTDPFVVQIDLLPAPKSHMINPSGPVVSADFFVVPLDPVVAPKDPLVVPQSLTAVPSGPISSTDAFVVPIDSVVVPKDPLVGPNESLVASFGKEYQRWMDDQAAQLAAAKLAAEAADVFNMNVDRLADAADAYLNKGDPRQALSELGSIPDEHLKAALKPKREEIQLLIDQAGKACTEGDTARNRDPAAAFAAYQRSAKGGHARGMLRLAQMYQAGEGTVRDATAAVKWYRRSATLQNVEAMIELGSMLEKGAGVEKAEARKWLDQAFTTSWDSAKPGDERARVDSLYNRGYGTTQDRQAYEAKFRKPPDPPVAVKPPDPTPTPPVKPPKSLISGKEPGQ